MKSSLKRCGNFVFSFLLGSFIVIPTYSSDLVEVLPLTDRIIMLHFDDGYIVYHKKGGKRSDDKVFVDPLDTNFSKKTSSYKISGINDTDFGKNTLPTQIGRKTKSTEFSWICQKWDNGCVNTDPDHVKEHWVYVFLSKPMKKGKTYEINTGNLAKNGSVWKLTYDPLVLRSEALHVNQLAYSTEAPEKYGYVYHWMGDKGSLDLKDYEGKAFYLVDSASKKISFTGKLKFRKPFNNKETFHTDDTPPNGSFSNAEVYECDFSGFNTPGRYVLAVEGIGSSFPFRIEKDAYREAFYWTMKGIYHQRSGIELKKPYTNDVRPAPHNAKITPGFKGKIKYSTFKFYELGNGYDGNSEDKLNVEAKEKGPLINAWGWYQDAGDWDGYASHTTVPAMLLFLYDIAPQKFSDNELNIPESGNGIPDLLDEATWLIRYFYRVRHEIMDKGWGTGGVAGGRVFGDLWGGDEKPDGTTQGSWEDTLRTWYVLGEDPVSSYRYSALASQLAFHLKNLGKKDPEGVDWEKEAKETYEWAMKNTSQNEEPLKKGRTNLANGRMYAAISLYRLNKDKRYHEQFIADFKAENYKDSDRLSWELLFPFWMYTLITDKNIKDEAFAKTTQSIVLGSADWISLDSTDRRACRFGGDFKFPMVVGQSTTPHVSPAAFAYFIHKKSIPLLAKQYIKCMYTTADYFLGCNPLNITWITGVGERSSRFAFCMDSWYMNGVENTRKGIINYGPWRPDQGLGSSNSGPWNHTWSYKSLYPNIKNWPGHERWFGQRDPLTHEYTIHQNHNLAAFVYGFLCADK